MQRRIPTSFSTSLLLESLERSSVFFLLLLKLQVLLIKLFALLLGCLQPRQS